MHFFLKLGCITKLPKTQIYFKWLSRPYTKTFQWKQINFGSILCIFNSLHYSVTSMVSLLSQNEGLGSNVLEW